MRRFVLHAVLAPYPRAWRRRDGQELHDLLDAVDRNGERSHTSMLLSLIAGAAEERAGVVRTPAVRLATIAVVAAALATVAFVTVSASGHATTNTTAPGSALQASSDPALVTANGSQVSYGDPSAAIEQQLQADIRKLCTQISTGQITATRRATAIEMDPTTGRVVAKIVQTCNSPA